jgi:thioredoxin-like negative regulator of GroEL
MKSPLVAMGLCALALSVVSAQQGGTTAPLKPAPAPTAGPYNEKADAKQDIAAALVLAKADKKNVLIDFGANWCPDCLVLSTLFDDSTVKGYREANFHVVQVDVGRFDKNLDVSTQYGNPIGKGIPAVVVLAPDGHMIDSTADGALESARHATPAEILGYLKKWAPKAH